MRVKLIKQSEKDPLRVVNADTGEVLQGIHDITYEASSCGCALLTIHIIDFDMDVVEEARVEAEHLPQRCKINIQHKTIEGGAIANRRQL